jgi:hypothetical protein
MENLAGMSDRRKGLEVVFELPGYDDFKRSEGKFAAQMPNEFLRRVRTKVQVSFIVIPYQVPPMTRNRVNR